MKFFPGVPRTNRLWFVCAIMLIAALGDASAMTVEVGSAYQDPGVIATDNYDGNISSQVVITSNVNTSVLGTYTVTYTVTDSSGNVAAPVSRTVRVVDTQKPVITLLGSASMTLKSGSAFSDPGATARDNYDGDLTARIAVSGEVNTAARGTYTLTYTVADASGNTATPVVRTVTVTDGPDTTKPVITRLGNPVVKIKLGRTYVDAGATARDNVGGDITSRIVTITDLNTWWPGTYSVAYNVKDAAGNAAATVYRKVKVSFYIKTDEDQNELLIASPLNGSTYYVPPNGTSAPLTLTASAPVGALSVEYALNDVVIGTAYEPPYAITVDIDPAAAGWGEYRVNAVAQMPADRSPVSATSTFTLAPLQTRDDANGNGIPDNPFATLEIEGDSWLRAVSVPETGNKRVVGMMRFEGAEENSIGEAPVVLVLEHPDDPARSVAVSVPRELIAGDETGMALVEIADDLDTLFGPAQAAYLLPEPENQWAVAGGLYVSINVLTTKDNGVTFDEVDPARLRDHPVHLDVQGLKPANPETVSAYRHSMLVDSDAVTGVLVTAGDGSWTTVGVQNLRVESTQATADLTDLSAVAFYESTQKSGQGCAGATQTTPFERGKTGDALLIAFAVAALLAAGKRTHSACS